jgi:hypothetical protein
MWELVKIVAAVVAIILLFETLDIAEILKKRLHGGLSRKEVEQRLAGLESRVVDLEKRTKS